MTTAQKAPAVRRRRRNLLLALVALAVAGALTAAWFLLNRPREIQPIPPRWPTVASTLAGVGAPGLAEGCGAGAAFDDPFGVAVDRAGTTYVADAGDNNVIWRIDANGCATILAGGREGLADGDGREAAFNSPSALALDVDGSLIVADTGNHAIRRVTPAGHVSTLAGTGQPGNADGPASAATFDGPIGVAVSDGRIVVADTYNDSIRVIAADGQVTTLAGGSGTGYRDGAPAQALFDTPSAVVAVPDGSVYVADTGNDTIRRIGPDGQVTTVGLTPTGAGGVLETVRLFRPIGLALGCRPAANRDRDSFQSLPCGGRQAATHVAGNAPETNAEPEMSPDLIFVTDGTGRVMALSMGGQELATFPKVDWTRPDAEPPFRNPTGVAVAPDGSLRVADSDNYLVRRLTRPGDRVPSADVDFTPVPWLTAGTLHIDMFPWPVDPQREWHEVAATLGEARGSVGGDGRERLHTGIDVRAPVGSTVRAVRDEKAERPIGATGFDTPNEALRVGAVTYVHVRVGRTARRRMLDPARFPAARDEPGQPARLRVRRGTRFRVGDPIGTVNRFAHVHLDVGVRSGEINPLSLPLAGFHDRVPPTIAAVDFYSEQGERVELPRQGPVTVSGRVAIVVDAYDRVDGNDARRRLGVYKLGYQVLREDGTPLPGFDEPRTTIEFDRLPEDPDAPYLLYAEGSGITVYGNKTTRFRYIVTNELHEGRMTHGFWDTAQLGPGTYRLRVFAADRSGNETTVERAILVR